MSIADADKIDKEVARLKKIAKERADAIEKETDPDKKERWQISLDHDLWSYAGMELVSGMIRNAGAAGDSKFIIDNSIKVEDHLVEGMVEQYKKDESNLDRNEKARRLREIEIEKWKIRGKQDARALL